MLGTDRFSPAAVAENNDLAARFCYWRGASGRRYIHTIYAPERCPPLPGAVYLAVVRLPGGERQVVAAGRFDELWTLSCMAGARRPDRVRRIDELHVHLLAADSHQADLAVADLAAAFGLADDRSAEASGNLGSPANQLAA